MIPTIILIGKPNVGKSLFFNNLTKFNKSLVFNYYGLTRNKNYAIVNSKNFIYLLIDTIGLSENYFNKYYSIKKNSSSIFDESDIIFFIVDFNLGITYDDMIISYFLRKIKKYIFLIINKVDNNKNNLNFLDFYNLGFGKPYIVSTCHNYNINNTVNSILEIYCFNKICKKKIFLKKKIYISLIGKSNVGKSSLFNSLMKKKYIFISNNQSTIDNSFLILKYKNFYFFLIDNYGLNYTNKFFIKNFKKISNLKSIKNIIFSNIIIFFFDYFNCIVNNDKYILNFSYKEFVGIIFIFNKSDLINLKEKIFLKKKIRDYITYIKNYYFLYISSTKKYNLNFLLFSLYKTYLSNTISISTFKLNKVILIFNNFVNNVYFNKKKSLYITQGGKNPLLIIVNKFNLNLKKKYILYLEKLLRRFFDLKGCRIKYKFN